MSISVLNTSVNLSGKTLLTAENPYTLTGLITFDRDPSAPFAVTSSSAVVTNLDADKLDGLDSTAFAILAAANTFAAGPITLNDSAQDNALRFQVAGVTKGYVGLSGLFLGTAATDIMLAAETGGVIKLYTNGSTPEVATFSTAGLLTITGGITSAAAITVNAAAGSSRFNCNVSGVTKAIFGLSGVVEGDSSEDGAMYSTGGLRFYTNGSATERIKIHASGGVSVASTVDPGANVFAAADNVTVGGGLVVAGTTELGGASFSVGATGLVTSDLTPATDGTATLGNASAHWATLFVNKVQWDSSPSPGTGVATFATTNGPWSGTKSPSYVLGSVGGATGWIPIFA